MAEFEILAIGLDEADAPARFAKSFRETGFAILKDHSFRIYLTDYENFSIRGEVSCSINTRSHVFQCRKVSMIFKNCFKIIRTVQHTFLIKSMFMNILDKKVNCILCVCNLIKTDYYNMQPMRKHIVW